MTQPDVVIKFENVSKRYKRRTLTSWQGVQGLWRRFRGDNPPCQNEFWAARDVSFSVCRGETLGVIGPNGAGKSTILKLIAGITAPTSGSISVTGRVGTLIELGAGFNPELPGRENIYLNAGVLGLKKREIDERFHEIVAFSGLVDVLDVPVKYYSSGMYAKLGFAVAAHVDADILLTDEILAVGDAAFQRQCLKRFQEIKGSTTILLVSHDLMKVKQLCSRALWIDGGRLCGDGDPETIIEKYMEAVQQARDRDLRGKQVMEPTAAAQRWGTGEIKIKDVTTHSSDGGLKSVFRTFEDLVIRIHYQVCGPFCDPGFGVRLHDVKGAWIHGANTFNEGITVKIDRNAGFIDLQYRRIPLLAGEYWITAGVTSGNNWASPYDLHERARNIEVVSSSPDGGSVCLEHEWGCCDQP